MPTKKTTKEKIEINFDDVFREIKQEEGVRMHNIMKELRIEPKETPEELLAPVHYDKSNYYKYLNWLNGWLRENGKTMYIFN